MYILDLERPFEVETNALDFTIGVVLSQRDNKGRLYPIVFLSRQLYRLELRYPIYDKELIAIIKVYR